MNNDQIFTFEVTAERGTIVRPGRHEKPKGCLEYAVFHTEAIPLSELPPEIEYDTTPQSAFRDTRTAVNIRSESGEFLAQAIHEELIHLTVGWWPLGNKDSRRRIESASFEEALCQIIAAAAERED